MNGSEGSKYSTAKLRCPIVEPGGITVGSGITFILNTSNNPINPNRLDIITTKNETVLKNFSSPKISIIKTVSMIMQSGTNKFVRSNGKLLAEPFTNAVINDTGKIIMASSIYLSNEIFFRFYSY
jgi:hypothetical protein